MIYFEDGTTTKTTTETVVTFKGLSENGLHGGLNRWKLILVHVEPVHNFIYAISFKLVRYSYTIDAANKLLKFSDAVMDMTFKGLKMAFRDV